MSRSTLDTEPFGRGRRKGVIYTADGNRKAFVTKRRLADIVRAGEKSISDAVRKGVGGWAMDEDTLFQLRAMGVRFVGVRVNETKDLYLTDIARFFNRNKATLTRFGPTLPLTQFRSRTGRVKL
jgi:hypothetical protein